MKIEKQKEAVVYQEGETQESIGMSLDLDSAQILMQMLSKNLYSDAIGSTIRECASNALDSHRRAGTDRPIIVSFGINSDSNYEFSVEDFGIGLDNNDVANIISKYGKSTKRNSDTELGMMGLGFKAPLAYTSSFYFICRKDGMERKYMMYEGEDVNTIDLLFEAPTEEQNGVKVIVPVQYADRLEFGKKIKEQLCYFENVFFDVKIPSRYSNYVDDTVDNNFSIFREDSFQISELAQDSKLHICLDNVYYPIDFDKLGIPIINCAVALRFSLTDGLFPTPNRESLRYTVESKKIILKRLQEFADYLLTKYNATVEGTENAVDVIRYYSLKNRMLSVGPFHVDVELIKGYASIPLAVPHLKGISLINIEKLCMYKDVILGEYKKIYFLQNGSFRELAKTNNNASINSGELVNEKFYLFGDIFTNTKKAFFREKLTTPGIGTLKFIKKVKPYKLGNSKSQGMQTYYEILQLAWHPKEEWRARIKEFQLFVSMITKNYIDVDNYPIPAEWYASRKKKTVKGTSGRTLKMAGDINVKRAVNLERYNGGKNCKFVPDLLKLQDIPKEKVLTVYTHHDDSILLDPLYKILEKQPLRFITLSSREIGIVEKFDIHNLIPYTKFMEGKTKPFKRVASAFLINRLMSSYNYTFTHRKELEGISTDLFNKVQALRDYHYKYFVDVYGSNSLYDPIISVAEEHNLFDADIHDVYLEVKGILERLPFVEPVMSTLQPNNNKKEKLKQALVDLFKYHKFKVDLDKYVKIDPNKKDVEETIEQLTN